MKKKIIGIIKLELIAGQATPAPPIGPILGRFGIDLIRFCKEYNAETFVKKGNICPVKIVIYEDKSFTFKISTMPTSKLILQLLNKSKGSSTPSQKYIGTLNENEIIQLAKIKQPDLITISISSIIQMIKGTARSMGVKIK